MLLILGPDRLLYRGPPVDGAMHRHHALQLAISLGDALLLEGEDSRQQAQGFVVAADTAHRLSGGAPQLALLYLEPESATGASLRAQLPTPLHAHTPGMRLQQQLAALDGLADEAHLAAAFDALCADWLGTLGISSSPPTAALDARIADTLTHLAATPGISQSAAVLARRVSLSPDRLMHLFATNTGLPLRRYGVWLKLKLAVRAALAGATLTEAAHASGFSDSAHLSHSFKAMFGLPPRFLFERRGALTVRLLGSVGT